MITPRVRKDLQAAQMEEGGVVYFDVRDFRSGGSMRLYDFEWLIAERMDGARTLEEIAPWVEERFGWRPSADDLRVFADRLAELGFVDDEVEAPRPVEAAKPAAPARDEDEIEEDNGPAIEISFEAQSAYTAEMAAVPPPVEEQKPATPPPQAAPAEKARPAEAEVKTEPVPKVPSSVAGLRAAAKEPEEKGSGLGWLLWLLLAVGAGLAAYVFVLSPGSQTAQVTLQTAPAPGKVLRDYGKQAKVRRGEPLALSFADGGTVGQINVTPGGEVKAGAVVVALEAFSSVAKDLDNLRERERYYAEKVKAAREKGNEKAIKENEAKVKEKQRLIADLESRSKKGALLAPTGGIVGEVLVAPGATVKGGEPVVKIIDQRMVADFELSPSDAKDMAVGKPVKVATASGDVVLAKVAQTDNAGVKVELPGTAKTVKPGDEVRLVKTQLDGVIALPASALTKSQGGVDQVFIAVDGVAKARPVMVVDRGPEEILVSQGVAAGDEVLVKFPPELQDGQKVAAPKKPAK